MQSKLQNELLELSKHFNGEVALDMPTRLMYATDASAYREIPLAVTYPKNKEDIKLLIKFAGENNTSIIPRTAGTSLAGQVVGNGIVADVSKYMTRILEVNEKEHWVKVEPGVVLDELNIEMAKYDLFFGPETSTANRCMIGGMVGNNACGAHSLVYGSTRDHTLELDTILSDGTSVLFKSLNNDEFNKKLKLETLEGDIYRNVNSILNSEENRTIIENEFPHPDLERRNTGYALDLLKDMRPFDGHGERFNFSKLLAGSEGTLAFTTSIKLNLVKLPPTNKALVCVHLNSVPDSLRANLIALRYKPVAVELMDRTILELTHKNIEQEKNRFFIKGNPGAILIVEFAEVDQEEIYKKTSAMEMELKAAGFGYHFPVITGDNMKKVWDLRKAGLGILNNMPGDAKPVAVIEDTAVTPQSLPEYISDFEKILKKYNKECVYHAHIATGELHLRPILNLRDENDVELFHTLAEESAKLVKKYKGSISGEHGDGRLRGEFIPLMVGDHNYQLFKSIKNTWDPHSIFNPGKIVDTPKMNTFLRYEPGSKVREIDTYFDFSEDQGIQRATEKCNGTAACRKTEIIGGTMCPSYMASRNENQTTRARANILREFLTHSDKENPFNHKEIYDVMDLCLSCKACKSECPSSVDVAKLKAEFLQHYYNENRIPLRTLLIANIATINKLGSIAPWIYNFVNQNKLLSSLTASFTGFSKKRKFPLLGSVTPNSWHRKNNSSGEHPNGIVYLFVDEFTKYNDSDIGITTIRLLSKLGYKVIIPKHDISARTYLSKGLVKKAKKIANNNVNLLSAIITDETPLIGIEPSAILTFRDEYVDLTAGETKNKAKELAKRTFLIDEFLEKEIKKGKISIDLFTDKEEKIKLHGHCHQKSLASTEPTKYILGFPKNYNVEEIPSGCCGMAGSFGFEKEHYELSMKVGELVLFPAVRESEDDTIIAAPGTSCRHQIKDGTERSALHPVEVLFNALK